MALVPNLRDTARIDSSILTVEVELNVLVFHLTRQHRLNQAYLSISDVALAISDLENLLNLVAKVIDHLDADAA